MDQPTEYLLPKSVLQEIGQLVVEKALLKEALAAKSEKQQED